MRLKLFLAVSLSALQAMACSYAVYQPVDCRLYRIMEDISFYEHDYLPNNREYLMGNFDYRQENLRLWREQTGTKMSDERLEKVIYGRHSEEDLKAFDDPYGADYYLRIARNVQKIREAMADPWYFPSNRSGGAYTESLEELAETCREEAKGVLRGRYVLQGLRCLNSMRSWQESIDFWEEQRDSLPKDVIYTMAEREVAAAYHQTEQDSIAADTYARVGDIASLRMCRTNRNDEMEYIYERYPDSPYFPEEIQVVLTRMDRKQMNYEADGARTKQFLKLCKRVIREHKVKNLAMWYYAAAATLDAMDQSYDALPYIQKGARLCKDEFFSKSFRILKIHVDARVYHPNQSYDKRLFADLQWLCEQIDSNMNTVEKGRLQKMTKYKWGEGIYYWNDAMRRILFSDVCPRLIAAGRTTRALQLANFADYYMIRKLDVNTIQTGEYYDSDNKPQTYEYDDFSYSSDLFDMVDSLPASQLASYVRWQTKGNSKFDRFLASGSNHDAIYWEDIVGTHYLRENNYEESVRWFSLLPQKYEKNLNIYRIDKDYLMRNPFDLSFKDPNSRRSRLKTAIDYKLNFAQKMVRYKEEMLHGKTADIRGEAKVYYAAGMRNQWDYCWALTKYSFSCSDYTEYDYSWNHVENKMYRDVKEQCNKMVQEGIDEIRNPEIKARLLHAMHRNREVMDHFPLTETARLLRLHCDTWRDYVCKN